jgi:hypothetical protein
VRLAAVRGTTVVHHPAAHGACERVPGVRRREVRRGHDRPVLPQLVREVGDAELGEGRQEECVRVLGREGEEALREVLGEAREQVLPEATDVGREGGGWDVQRERLVRHGRVLREAADEDPNGVPRGLPQAGGAGGRVRGRDFAP